MLEAYSNRADYYYYDENNTEPAQIGQKPELDMRANAPLLGTAPQLINKCYFLSVLVYRL